MHPNKEGIDRTMACHLKGLTVAQRISVAVLYQSICSIDIT